MFTEDSLGTTAPIVLPLQHTLTNHYTVMLTGNFNTSFRPQKDVFLFARFGLVLSVPLEGLLYQMIDLVPICWTFLFDILYS